MVESGLKGGFWYRALVNAKDTRNVTYHDQIKTTLHYFILGEQHSDVEHTHTSMKTTEKGKHVRRAVDGVNLGFSQRVSRKQWVCHMHTNTKESNHNQ